MSTIPVSLLAGHPFSEYTQANASFAAPQLHLVDKNQLFHKMGLEEESPATDDLLKHISSTFLDQNPGVNPAKAIISLLLGLSAQVDKLNSEVRTLAARHNSDITLLNTRINNNPPHPAPAPAPTPQARPPTPRQPAPTPRQPSRHAQTRHSLEGLSIEGVPDFDFYPNAPGETIDLNGNRRLLTYSEALSRHQSATNPAGLRPAIRSGRPRTPAAQQTPANLPAAQRRFYATRSTPAPFPNHQQLEAKLPSDLGRVLAGAGLAHPHTALQVQVNRNGTITCTASPSTPAKTIAPYFPGLLEVLNLACDATENPFNDFQLAPTNTDYAVHNVPIFAMDVPESLFTPHIAEAVSLTTGATITRARYLSKPENRLGKTTTSIVISVPAEDTGKIGDQIRLFGRSRRCSKLWPASPNTLCRKCARLGHATEGCQASSPTCPLCAGDHLRKDHRCPNQNCPKEGHLKPVANCCPTWKAKCANCSGNHTASDKECPSRRSRPHPTPSGPPPAPAPTTPAQTTTPPSTSVPAPQHEGAAEEDANMTH